jgi:selenide, water dikinase
VIYLDNAATTLRKPPQVEQAVLDAMRTAGNPGRGAHEPTLHASRLVYAARCAMAKLLHAPDPSCIAFAANALSDVYAMGGEVKTALNLVCFPESMDLNILGEILRGGAKKVAEAGGSLAGGHSIADTGVKYGLSVTGLVDPKKMYTNDSGRPGDKLILTKALGVGLICTANRVGEAAPEDMAGAIASMTTLNKNAAEISRKYTVHAATDVTGFSFLGHLHEMMGGKLSCIIDARMVPVLPGAEKAADDFLYTAAGQRNRNHTGPYVTFENVPFAMEEVLFDPQTSGGLLLAVLPEEANALEAELQAAGLPAKIVGEIIPKAEQEITVKY